MGSAWPLSVAKGVLRCREPGAVTFEAGGMVYAVNGIARQSGECAEIDPIWVDDPDIPGAKMDIGPIIDRGLELCG